MSMLVVSPADPVAPYLPVFIFLGGIVIVLKFGEDFLDWILDKIEWPTREAHPSRERDETEQAKALRIVQEELKRRGWTKAELKRRRKGDEAKVALARRLREETAVSLRWIAENLYMGTWTHVSNRLYHCR